MSRAYHVEIAAFVANADPKWVDNLLSHFAIPGVEAARQGVSRKISVAGIRHVALVRQLSRNGGLSVRPAIELATRLLTSEDGRATAGPHVAISLDVTAFTQWVDARLADAAEASVPARRGRPRRRAA